MAEKEIDLVHLEVLERTLEHVLCTIKSRGIAWAKGKVGHLGRAHIGLAGMTAQRTAGNDFRLAISRSGIEIVDTMGYGIIDHFVDGSLV